MKERYILVLNKQAKKTKLALSANDSAHAQAQALDIIRAFNADGYSLTYGTHKNTDLSELFNNLAFNIFNHKSCYSWTATECNKVPCCYVFGERFYLRNVILKYLDIPKDDLITKNSCKCASCVNPYHFAYVSEKNEKLSSGDLKLLVAYRSRGAEVSQIAKALKVHRSTIYRRLKDEPLSART